jgi:hypothetical protein
MTALANRRPSLGSLFPPLATFGAVGMAGLVVIDFVVASTAPKSGNCFATGSLGDAWLNGVSGVGLYLAGATILVALAGVAFTEGRRLYCLGLGLVAAGAGFLCLLFAIGNTICE